MRKSSPVLALISVTLLAGCWQSDHSLLSGRTPVEPFKTGPVEGRNRDNKTGDHSRLTREAGGVYRLTNDEKGSSDFGDSFTVRFFALAGAPSGVFIYEAQEVKKCKPGDNMCDPAHPDHTLYYGLARTTAKGAEIINPDCGKDSAEAKLPGVKTGDYGCSFTSRASLEKALGDLAQTSWKPNVTYTFK
jgi:hypothetical protein